MFPSPNTYSRSNPSEVKDGARERGLADTGELGGGFVPVTPPSKGTHVQVVDDVLGREQVDHAHSEGEGCVEEEVALDVVEQPRLGQVLDVGKPVLRWRRATRTARTWMRTI